MALFCVPRYHNTSGIDVIYMLCTIQMELTLISSNRCFVLCAEGTFGHHDVPKINKLFFKFHFV